MFIDMHVHPAFYEPINGDPGLEDLRHDTLDIHLNGVAPLEHVFNQMRCAGLDRLCLLPQDYSSLQSRPLVSNDEIRRLVDLAPDRFIGFASVDPLAPGAEEKLERAFGDLKLAGLKLHPGKLRFYPHDERLARIYDICERHDRPVIFHSGLSWEPDTESRYGHPLEFERLAGERPGLRICLAHFAWPWVREAAMLMVKHANVYADTGALYFDSAGEFTLQLLTRDVPATWIDRSLRHQVMFGSNNPRFEQIRMAHALDALIRHGYRESTLSLIKGDNALAFLGRNFQ